MKRADVVKIVGFVTCLLAQAVAFSAEHDNDHFLETVTKQSTENGQNIKVRQLCLKDQSIKVDDDIVAVINKASGKVMADTGKGFVGAPEGTLLKEDNRVVTLDESVTEIVFFDCCKTTLKSNNMITIKGNPGCKAAILDAAGHGVAWIHPGSYIPPAAGVFILIKGISLE